MFLINEDHLAGLQLARQRVSAEGTGDQLGVCRPLLGFHLVGRHRLHWLAWPFSGD